MAASMWKIRDDLWEVAAPLLPVHEPSLKRSLCHF